MTKQIFAKSFMFAVNEAAVDTLAPELESWMSSRNIVHKAVQQHTNKVTNATILKMSTVDLVASGTESVLNARRVQERKQYMEELVRDEDNKQPDMENG